MKQYQRSKVPPRPEKLKAPVSNMAVHPFVWWVWNEINRQRTSQEDVATRAGVSSSLMRKWRRGVNSPRLNDIEAVINVLGGKLVIRSEDHDNGTTTEESD